MLMGASQQRALCGAWCGRQPQRRGCKSRTACQKNQRFALEGLCGVVSAMRALQRTLHDVKAVVVVAEATCCDDGLLAEYAADGREATVDAFESHGACEVHGASFWCVVTGAPWSSVYHTCTAQEPHPPSLHPTLTLYGCGCAPPQNMVRHSDVGCRHVYIAPGNAPAF